MIYSHVTRNLSTPVANPLDIMKNVDGIGERFQSPYSHQKGAKDRESYG